MQKKQPKEVKKPRLWKINQLGKKPAVQKQTKEEIQKEIQDRMQKKEVAEAEQKRLKKEQDQAEEKRLNKIKQEAEEKEAIQNKIKLEENDKKKKKDQSKNRRFKQLNKVKEQIQSKIANKLITIPDPQEELQDEVTQSVEEQKDGNGLDLNSNDENREGQLTDSQQKDIDIADIKFEELPPEKDIENSNSMARKGINSQLFIDNQDNDISMNSNMPILQKPLADKYPVQKSVDSQSHQKDSINSSKKRSGSLSKLGNIKTRNQFSQNRELSIDIDDLSEEISKETKYFKKNQFLKQYKKHKRSDSKDNFAQTLTQIEMSKHLTKHLRSGSVDIAKKKIEQRNLSPTMWNKIELQDMNHKKNTINFS